MAGTKVTLRTAFNDEFIVGGVTITQQGTTVDSRTKADEILDAAQQAGVLLFEVEPSDVKKTEGSGS